MNKNTFIFKIFLTIGFLTLGSIGTFGAANWQPSPSFCPSTDPSSFPGQNCTPVNICGDNTGTAQCFNTSTLTPPNTNTTSTSTTQYRAGSGGYVINCNATVDGAAPYCDNGGNFWCNPDTSCFGGGNNRETICNANLWSSSGGSFSCGGCLPTHLDCGGDTRCEIQKNATDYPTGGNNHYGDSCLNTDAKCDTNYFDCDASGITAGNGCEQRSGTACTQGGLAGTIQCTLNAGGMCTNGTNNYTCTCSVPKQYFETGTLTTYSTTDPLLWGQQFGSGPLIQFGNGTTDDLFILNNDGSIQIADIVAPTDATNRLYSIGGNLYWNGGIIGSSGAGIWDTDSDTGIQVEATPDDDIIRMYTGGTERFRIDELGQMKLSSDWASSSSALFEVGSGSEPSTFAVSAEPGYLNIATFRDVNGENIFRVKGSLASDDALVTFGDYDGAYGSASMSVNSGVGYGHMDLTEMELRFKESPNLVADYVGFKAPSSIPTSLIWTLPSIDGNSGEVLVTDGSGILSWANLSTGNLQEVTDNGNTTTNDIQINNIGFAGDFGTDSNGDYGIFRVESVDRLSQFGGNSELLLNPEDGLYVSTQGGSARLGLSGLNGNSTLFLGNPIGGGLALDFSNISNNNVQEFQDSDGVIALLSDIAINSANNGISINGGIAQLGGTLNQATSIDFDGNTMTFDNIGYFYLADSLYNASIEHDGGALSFRNSSGAGVAIGTGFGLDLSVYDDSEGIVVLDSRSNTRGIEYFDDYSSGFTDRSLVDKEYVDNALVLNTPTWQETINQSIAEDGYVRAGMTAGEIEDDGGQLMIRAYDGYDMNFGTMNLLTFNFAGGVGDVSVVDNRLVGDRRGIEYYADYSADFTDRSLVDKGYVDGLAFSTSPWLDDGTSVYLSNLTRNVGIGSATAYFPLDVTGDQIVSIFRPTSNSRGGLVIGNNSMFSIDEAGLYDAGGDYPLAVFDATNDHVHYGYYITQDINNGEVGIGTQDPNARLHVLGGTVLMGGNDGEEIFELDPVANTLSLGDFRDWNSSTLVRINDNDRSISLNAGSSASQGYVVLGNTNSGVGTTNQLRFQELDSNGTNFVALRSPDNLASDIVFTLPSSQASGLNDILVNDGSGNLSWTSANGLVALNLQEVTDNGNTTNNSIEVNKGTGTAELIAISSSDDAMLTLEGNAGATTIRMSSNGGLNWATFETSSDGSFNLVPNGNSSIWADAEYGYVGIQHNNPAFALDVVGDVKVSEELLLGTYATAGLPVSGSQVGSLVYNTSTSTLNFWNGSSWSSVATGTMPTQHWQKNTNVLSPQDNAVYQIGLTNNSANTLTGFKATNTNDVSNYAGAVLELKGSGADFTNNVYFGKYGAGFWVPSWAGNGVLATDKNLVVSAVGGTSLVRFQVGGGYSAPVSRMTLDSDSLDILESTRLDFVTTGGSAQTTSIQQVIQGNFKGFQLNVPTSAAGHSPFVGFRFGGSSRGFQFGDIGGNSRMLINDYTAANLQNNVSHVDIAQTMNTGLYIASNTTNPSIQLSHLYGANSGVRFYTSDSPVDNGYSQDLTISLTQLTAGSFTNRFFFTHDGRLGINASDPDNALQVEGGITINDVVPHTTTNALYNNSGTLYWNGAPVGGTTSVVTTDNATAGTHSIGDIASANIKYIRAPFGSSVIDIDGNYEDGQIIIVHNESGSSIDVSPSGVNALYDMTGNSIASLTVQNGNTASFVNSGGNWFQFTGGSAGYAGNDNEIAYYASGGLASSSTFTFTDTEFIANTDSFRIGDETTGALVFGRGTFPTNVETGLALNGSELLRLSLQNNGSTDQFNFDLVNYNSSNSLMHYYYQSNLSNFYMTNALNDARFFDMNSFGGNTTIGIGDVDQSLGQSLLRINNNLVEIIGNSSNQNSAGISVDANSYGIALTTDSGSGIPTAINIDGNGAQINMYGGFNGSHFEMIDGNQTIRILAGTTNNTSLNLNSNNATAVLYGGDNYGTRVEIDDATGRVIIGGTSNSMTMDSNNGTLNIDLQSITLGNGSIASGDVVTIQDSNGVCTLDPGSGASWSCSSDKALKHDIEDLSVGLDIVLALRPTTFKMNIDNSEKTGFIAQEVESVMPALVSTLPGGYLGVKEGGMIPYIIKAIQEQQQQIDLLKFEGVNISELDKLAINGVLLVNGEVTLGQDTIGEAVILAGDTSVEIRFETEYEYQPVVTISKLTSGKLDDYYISDITTEGFTINIDPEQENDVYFSWHSFSSKDGNLSFSEYIASLELEEVVNESEVIEENIETEDESNTESEEQEVVVEDNLSQEVEEENVDGSVESEGDNEEPNTLENTVEENLI